MVVNEFFQSPQCHSTRPNNYRNGCDSEFGAMKKKNQYFRLTVM